MLPTPGLLPVRHSQVAGDLWIGVSGWRASWFLPELKADCVPGWMTVW